MSHVDIDIGGFYIHFEKKEHVYTVNEPIDGKLYLKLRSSIKSCGLYLRVMGKLGVLWREGDDPVISQIMVDPETINGEPYSTSENFLDEKIFFIKPPEGEEFVTIDKGDHEFKFSFRLTDFVKGGQITQTKINAALPFTSDHEYGSIKYMITGVLPRHEINDYDFQTVQFFKVISSIGDFGDTHRFFLPYKAEASTGTNSSVSSPNTSSSSKSSLRVTINKTAFRPGETINAILRLENESSLRKFSKCYVKLIQKATFHSKEPSSKYKIHEHDIFSYKQTDFDNHKLYEMDELIQIPKSTQPASTMDPVHHIQYKYVLKVELYTTLKYLPGGTSQPLEIIVPVIIYNEESKA